MLPSCGCLLCKERPECTQCSDFLLRMCQGCYFQAPPETYTKNNSRQMLCRDMHKMSALVRWLYYGLCYRGIRSRGLLSRRQRQDRCPSRVLHMAVTSQYHKANRVLLLLQANGRRAHISHVIRINCASNELVFSCLIISSLHNSRDAVYIHQLAANGR